MPSRLIIVCVVLVLAGTGEAVAQVSGNHGSIYSRFVIGDRVDNHSSQSAMMGGAGSALGAASGVSLANPALWGRQSLVRLGVGAEVAGLVAEDALGQTSTFGSGHLTSLQVTLPLVSDVLGATIALRPYTRVNYLAVQDGQVILPDLPRDTIDYRVHFGGSGGLHEAQLGFGWSLSSAVSIGVSGRALFGMLEDQRLTEFSHSDIYPETLVSRRTRMWGFGATVGAAVHTGGLLASGDQLNLGAAFTLPTSLQGRRVGTLGFSLDQDTLRAEVRGTTRIPLNATAGFAYAPSASWLVAADVRYEPWTSFESDFSFTGYDPTTGEHALQDRLRIGGGFQYIPAGTDRNAPLMARTAYRLGSYFDRGYVSPHGMGISTMALTGGLSLPALAPGTRFDLGFEVGTRGTTDSGLVRDLFFKGTATINFSERWFIRRQFG